MADRSLTSVLGKASEKELIPLAELLDEKTWDWDWDTDWTLPELRGELEHELRLNGGHTIANWSRGEGPSWKEIVRDVADKLNVEYNDNESTIKIEQKVTASAFDKLIENMTTREINKFRANLSKAGFRRDIPITSGLLSSGMMAGNIAGFAPYKGIVIIANSIATTLTGSGLAFGTNMFLTKSISVILGPIGWLVTGLVSALQIAGPAYRITCPSVVMVSLLRSQQKIKSERGKRKK